MKWLLLLLVVCFSEGASGQAIDSIQYEYGYLYYRTYGSGEPVIMLSGGPGNNALQLETVAKKLPANYKVILFEQRGTGLSTPLKFDSTTINFESALGDINLLLSHLGLKRVIIFGHSYGASLALVYACKFPGKVKSLVLLAPGYFGFAPSSFDITVANLMGSFSSTQLARMNELERKVANKTITDTETLEMQKLGRVPYIYDQSKLDSLYPLIDGRNNRITFQLLRRDFAKQNFDVMQELDKIKCPVHLICGRQDFLAYIAYELKISKPSISLYWIEKSGHFPMHEQAEEFYRILFDVLKNLK